MTDTGVSSVLPDPTMEHTTLAVDDTLFNENLEALYERRILGVREVLETLDFERSKILNRSQLISTLRKKI